MQTLTRLTVLTASSCAKSDSHEPSPPLLDGLSPARLSGDCIVNKLIIYCRLQNTCVHVFYHSLNVSLTSSQVSSCARCHSHQAGIHSAAAPALAHPVPLQCGRSWHEPLSCWHLQASPDMPAFNLHSAVIPSLARMVSAVSVVGKSWREVPSCWHLQASPDMVPELHHTLIYSPGALCFSLLCQDPLLLRHAIASLNRLSLLECTLQ